MCLFLLSGPSWSDIQMLLLHMPMLHCDVKPYSEEEKILKWIIIIINIIINIIIMWPSGGALMEYSEWGRWLNSISWFCIAQYHKLQMCLRGLYNLYTYDIPDLWPHIG